VDTNGNVVVTGYVWGTSDDYLTIKYSSAGVLLWANRYNGPGNALDRAKAVAVDASGNVVVTGQSSSFGSYPYNSDFATIMYSSSGVPIWTNRYDGPASSDDDAHALALDAGGNVYVTGQSWGGAYYDYATIKYSNAGVPLWTNRYNGPESRMDVGWALALDPGGNVYVTGQSQDSSGNYGIATVAYSSAAMPLWSIRYHGVPNTYKDGRDVAVDVRGNVYVAGTSRVSGIDDIVIIIKYVIPPIIIRQPVGWTNAVGTTASFTVEVAGGLPLSYQWRRDGTNLVEGGRLSGVTSTNLSIANVQLEDALDYTVVVTNEWGSATSVAAHLTVTIPPSAGRFTNIKYSAESGFSFIFRDGTVGQPYRIQRSASAAEGSWTDWMNFTYSEPTVFTDVSATGAERRFYRAVTP
jgi:hypothetical protein